MKSKEITEEEFELLSAKLRGQPKSMAEKLINAKGEQCVRVIPTRYHAMLTGAIEARFSRTHCRAIYEDGTDEVFEVTHEELERLNEDTNFLDVISLIQSKRNPYNGGVDSEMQRKLNA